MGGIGPVTVTLGCDFFTSINLAAIGAGQVTLFHIFQTDITDHVDVVVGNDWFCVKVRWVTCLADRRVLVPIGFSFSLIRLWLFASKPGGTFCVVPVRHG